MNTKLILFLTLIFLLFSCNTDDENAVTYPETLELTYDFQNDNQSWEGDFADYPLGEESFYELSYELSNLPTPLNTNSGALKQSGNNHSDDLFMFFRRQINGLKPNTDYRVPYEIEFASDVAGGQVGVGGSPGESVTIKAGAVITKPEKVNQSGFYQMNMDKNNKANSGFETYLISDANATFDRIGINGEKYNSETIHLTTLDNFNEEFTTVWNSEKLMSEI